jgi:hypothetical protein
MVSWTRVNGTEATAGGTDNVLRASLSLTPGNLVIVAMANDGAFLAPSDGSNTYIKLSQMSTSPLDLTLYYTIVTTGGTQTIGAPTSNVGAMGITQFNPGGGTISVDGTVATNNGGGTGPTSGNIPCSVGDLIVGGYTSESASTFSPTAPTLADFNVATVSGKNLAGALLYNLSASANPSVLSGTITSSPWAFIGAAFKSTPIGYSVSGPTSGNVGVASTNFTLTPAATTTDTVTPSDGGAGGTFTPTSLSWAASAAAKTFTYTPATTGPISLTVTSANGGVITGSPLSYTAAASGPPPTGTSVIPSISFQFAAAIIATDLTITVTISATSASFPGTTTYNSGTRTATFTPSSPFVLGTKYLVVVSGATAADGTAMSPSIFPFTPGTLKSTGWFAGLSRPLTP